MATESKTAIGDVLDGKYEITDILGEGAMGVVYRARHKRLNRVVAVKTMRSEFASEQRLIERFETEARAASAIGHPNIVQVFDAGEEPGGMPYLVMEYLEGQSLGELLQQEGCLSIPRTIDICCQVLSGLGAAHAAGILHRDLKPDNIFISLDAQGHDRARILDFGISKFLNATDADHSSATQIGTVLGTPAYMSPEQASGRSDIDGRADLWAVMCVLYKCIVGKPPFAGDNYNQILAAVIQGRFVSLREQCPAAPLRLHELVARGLTVEREERLPDATSLSVALTELRIAITEESMPLPEVAKEESPKAAEDPAMLAAFDNMADRFLLQEEQDAEQVAEQVSRAKAPVAFATAAVAKVSEDRFAPPGSSEQVSLALDIDEPQRPEEPISPSRSRSAPRPARRSGKLVTRREPGRVGPVLLKLTFLATLVAGGGAGYRYYTLGYVLPPVLAAKAQLSLSLHPDSAQVFVSGKPSATPELSLNADTMHTLRIEAKGRLSMVGQVQFAAGFQGQASVALSHLIPQLRADSVATIDVVDAEAPTRLAIDVAHKKISAFGDCGARLSAAFQEEFVRHKSKSAPQALPATLSDECSLTLEYAAQMAPPMATLDEASAHFLTAVGDFNRAVLERKKSAGASAKIMRKRQQAFRKAVQLAKRSVREWARASSSAEARWLMLETLRVQADEGRGVHSLMRELAVSCDAWMRTHLAGEDARTQRAYLLERLSAVQEASAQEPELYARYGTSRYLKALEPLISKKPGEDVLFWHNQAVDAFNGLSFPLNVAGGTGTSEPLVQ